MAPRLNQIFRNWLVRRGYYLYRIEHKPEFREYLDETSAFTVSRQSIRDKRADTRYGESHDTTLTPEGLADVLARPEFCHGRVLEIGPKWGIHTRWISENLEPSELVLCELPRKLEETKAWRDELQCKNRWIYGNFLTADELLSIEPVDLVLFLGVIYHNVEPVRSLNLLNRITRLGGHMLLESTIDSRPDPLIRVQYGDFTKMFPSVAALRILLAWTGWRRVVQFADYRPGSDEALFLCEKTHEVDPDYPQPHTTMRWDPPA